MDDTPGTAGFSGDTEILTRAQGWIAFGQLTCLDEVATRTPDGRFEWQHPERVDVRRYDGEMVHLLGRSLDLLVTPDQPVLCSGDARSQPRSVPAAGLMSRRSVALVAVSTWDAPDVGEKVFPGVRRSTKGPSPRDVRMTGDQFAAFMGMYMAEGNTASGEHFHKVSIAQMDAGKGYEEYRALLTAICGREPGRGGHQWQVYSRPLYEYLHPLGIASGKWLPGEVLGLSSRQLGIFWRYYFLGDGSYERHPGTTDVEVIATASARLAGQVQEIVQKLGYCGSVRRYAPRPNAQVPVAGFIYKLRVRRTERPSCAVRMTSYTGEVVRAETPSGTAYVRRDGKPIWAAL